MGAVKADVEAGGKGQSFGKLVFLVHLGAFFADEGVASSANLVHLGTSNAKRNNLLQREVGDVSSNTVLGHNLGA